MTRGDWFVLWIIGIVAFGVWAGFAVFAPAARLRRRRRKSHSPLASKTRRPMVRFSVRTHKKEK